MNILIDFSQIPVEKVGVGNYADNLIKQIAVLNRNDIYYVLINDDDPSLDILASHRIKLIKVKGRIFRKLIFRLFLEQIFIPYCILRYKINVIHSLHYSFPFITFRAKKVVSIHDMTFFLFPQCHEMLKVFYFQFFIKAAARCADKLITDSNSSLTDFINFAKPKTDDVSVIYLGKAEWGPDDYALTKTNEIKQKYGINGEYLLFIGTIEPRKNIERIVAAFQRFLNDHNNYTLVITGRKGWKYDCIFEKIAQLGLQNKIIYTGYVKEEEKPALIKGAKLFIYPSLYEGFGIPVLEAMSLGVPTITSNLSSMPEIAGNAAYTVDPTDIDEIYKGMKKIIEDKRTYKELQARSVEQANNFSWKSTAEKTLFIYDSVNAKSI